MAPKVEIFRITIVYYLCFAARALQTEPPSFTVKQNDHRRSFLNKLALGGPAIGAACVAAGPWPAKADLASAGANGVPMLGRFEKLTGANSFIGNWKYEGTKGPPTGELVFLKNGEVELRSLNDPSIILGVGAVPWKYVSPKGQDTMVKLSFTIDADDEDDVLIFQGELDSAGGPDRMIEGSIETGRAEVGARGGGPRKRVGSFAAKAT